MNAAPLRCDDCRLLLGGYVLDALEHGEQVAVERHVASCARCAQERDALARLPLLLDYAGTAEAVPPPSPALEEAVLDRFAREHRSDRTRRRLPRVGFALPAPASWLRRPLPVAVAAAVAALAVVVGLQVGGGNSAEAYHARLVGSRAASGATALARLVTTDSGTRVQLHVRGLHGSPGDVYEVWCIRDGGGEVTAGTFRVDESGRADVALTTAAVPNEYHHMAIVRDLGSGGGQRLLAGTIQYR